jgi:hypothetical protein
MCPFIVSQRWTVMDNAYCDVYPDARRKWGISPAQGHSEEFQMFAYTYPLLSIFWTMLEFFLFFIWIWLIISVFSDIFRSHDIGGLAKALWVIFVVILPYVGVFVYLIARGGKMHERAAVATEQQQKAFNSYIQQATGGSGAADELSKLVELKEKGALTDAECEDQKAKILA